MTLKTVAVRAALVCTAAPVARRHLEVVGVETVPVCRRTPSVAVGPSARSPIAYSAYGCTPGLLRRLLNLPARRPSADPAIRAETRRRPSYSLLAQRASCAGGLVACLCQPGSAALQLIWVPPRSDERSRRVDVARRVRGGRACRAQCCVIDGTGRSYESELIEDVQADAAYTGVPDVTMKRGEIRDHELSSGMIVTPSEEVGAVN